MGGPGDVTQLLRNWAAGDGEALAELVPLVQAELRKLAGSALARERANHILQPTALVNEAYLRLVNQGQVPAQSRSHFFGIAARLMRQILVDYARANAASKRGGGARQVTLDERLAVSAERCDELLDVHAALEELARSDARKAEVVELRYFGGLDVEETAAVLGVSANTVIRDWSLARAWLLRHLDQRMPPV